MLATGLSRAGYDRVFVPTCCSIAIGFSQFLPVLRSRAWFKFTPINFQCRLARLISQTTVVRRHKYPCAPVTGALATGRLLHYSFSHGAYPESEILFHSVGCGQLHWLGF